MAEFPLSTSQLLAGLAALLLVFVSGGVVYLSSVEWRDRRRRNAVGKPRRS
uniref:hypothetical protein n=1 Tax=Cyanobium sp. TaxID=2164130 RepID=UPI004047ADE6